MATVDQRFEALETSVRRWRKIAMVSLVVGLVGLWLGLKPVKSMTFKGRNGQSVTISGNGIRVEKERDLLVLQYDSVGMWGQGDAHISLGMFGHPEAAHGSTYLQMSSHGPSGFVVWANETSTSLDVANYQRVPMTDRLTGGRLKLEAKGDEPKVSIENQQGTLKVLP